MWKERNCKYNNNNNNNNNNSNNNNNNNNYNNNIRDFPFLPTQEQPMESLISAIALCMQLIFDAIREASSSGVGLRENDSRSLAKACIEILSSTQSSNQSVWGPTRNGNIR